MGVLLMGCFQKLFGTSMRQVTPDQMARMTVQTAVGLAFQGDNSTHDLLESTGVQLANEDGYEIELVVYHLFLFDVVINRVFGSGGRQIRDCLRSRFAELVQEFLKDSGVDPGSERELTDFLERRFTEYTPALRRSMESEGETEDDALAFPKAACQCILGSDDPNLQTMLLLSSHWPTVLDQMSDGFKKYEIVAED